MADILTRIVEKRKLDIERLGLEFGFSVPEKRTRPVHPFLVNKGVILEVKRASPSKGDIAPDLDSAETALSYAQSGASAISCLTEKNFFKGDLSDLMAVCRAMDEFESGASFSELHCGSPAESGCSAPKCAPAVLRKDFLLSADEIDVSYRSGADAVLLIARILDCDTIVSMAKRAADYQMTSLLEVRSDDDLEKLKLVASSVDKKFIVCGVNSRDLATFKIDLLKPCSMMDKIRSILGDGARVIFESGIRTVESASFAGSLGFTGMLLGEAAAKNPDIRKSLVQSFVSSSKNANADFWNEIAVNISGQIGEKSSVSPRPLVKICGITNIQDARKACELGADFLGFVFFAKSPHNVKAETVTLIKKILESVGKKHSKLIGVIVDSQSPEGKEAISLAKEGILDAIQLHTIECARSFLEKPENRKIAHYAAVNITSSDDLALLDELFELGEPRILVDAQTKDCVGGSGKRIDSELVTQVLQKQKLWLAGGISPENIAEVLKEYSPELVDLSSSLESVPGKKDFSKLEKFFVAMK